MGTLTGKYPTFNSILEDVVFDRNDALKMFADIAQEAISSENCSISDEFYY